MSRLIYSLRCPFTNEIHYIGKSTKGMSRPLSHLKKSHSEKVKSWVDDLRVLGQKPSIDVLEWVSVDDNIDDRERYYIQKALKENNLLLNSVLVTPVLVSTKLDELINGEIKDIADISNFIKERRKRAGLTQEEFAEKCGVALTVLRKIEQNKTNVNLDGLITVLSMFGARLDVKLNR